ncbi:phosphatase PAP2 family protein [Nocardia stercoris]|uniref:phosphatase PAP2 family protein n=1 Tax=Nocardia stercoris TaxID=2483361 RepID=UPI001319DD66|nr:phosphatase PAP2 family protein [Nocardia stercoris]
MSFDRDIVTWFAGHRTPVLTTAARWAMELGTGEPGMAVLAVLFVAAVVVGRWWRAGFTIGVSVLLAQAVARALKQVVARPRPPGDLAAVQVGAYSMPSTVAAMTAALAVALYAVVQWRRGFRPYAAALLVTGLGVIACAMVYLGAHWPTDVLAGWCVGALVGFIVIRLSRTVFRGLLLRAARSD